MERADIAIVGSGPAGVSAAINARIRHKSFYLFGAAELSDKVRRAERISNYPGLPDVSGTELNRRLMYHLEQARISITQKRITGIYNMGDYFTLLADTEEFEAASVILATGVESLSAVKGERELLGRGVSYCATCDGNLYRGRSIAVVCDNASMEHEVEYLAGLAEKVYYCPLFKQSVLSGANTEIMTSPIAKIDGDDRVSGITCRDGREITLDGVFFLKQSVSPAVLLRGLAMNIGHVEVKRDMSTNIEGCFAAGDCTGDPYQIAKAVGEGNIAAHSAFAWLARRTEKQGGAKL